MNILTRLKNLWRLSGIDPSFAGGMVIGDKTYKEVNTKSEKLYNKRLNSNFVQIEKIIMKMSVGQSFLIPKQKAYTEFYNAAQNVGRTIAVRQESETHIAVYRKA